MFVYIMYWKKRKNNVLEAFCQDIIHIMCINRLQYSARFKVKGKTPVKKKKKEYIYIYTVYYIHINKAYCAVLNRIC